MKHNVGFADRLKAAAEAKQARVAQFKPKAAAPAADFVHRSVVREAELQAVREARAAAKEAERLAAIAAEETARAALANDEQYQIELKRNERKDRKAQAKAEARAKREANQAARRR